MHFAGLKAKPTMWSKRANQIFLIKMKNNEIIGFAFNQAIYNYILLRIFWSSCLNKHFIVSKILITEVKDPYSKTELKIDSHDHDS